MEKFKQLLKDKGFSGEIDDSAITRDLYSHDASLFEIRPQLVVSPKDSNDVQALISLVAQEKDTNRELSVTARSAGTDMAGGAINDSIIVDFNKHFTSIEHVTRPRNCWWYGC
jgi:FAD/FMN-containing dehydrogenase